jgi:SAM-dependent methyltransferase
VQPASAAASLNGSAGDRPTIESSLRELASEALSLVDARWTIHPEYERLLAPIDFRGRKTLDLGCGAGDVSRWVRGQGASLVDGVEEDEAVLAAARLVNAAEGSARVFFYGNALPDTSTYSEHYDVVLALGVLADALPAIEAVADVVDELLVVEVGSRNAAEQEALRAVERRFPHSVRLGTVGPDAARGPAERKARRVIAFSKKPVALAGKRKRRGR